MLSSPLRLGSDSSICITRKLISRAFITEPSATSFMTTIENITKPVIVQILPEVNKGGVERGTFEMVQAITARGWRAVVISNGGIMRSSLERAGAVCYELPVHTKNPLKWGLVRRRLKAILIREGADIVHVRSRAPGWIALPVARRLNIPTVSTIHAKFTPKSPFKRLYNGKMLSADRVIAISDYVRDVIHTHYKKMLPAAEIAVIHRGVDLELFDPQAVHQSRIIAEADRLDLPDSQQVVMLPSRASPWKGHEILIRAMAHLERDDVVVLMLGAGDGDMKFVERLRSLAMKTGLGGRLRIASSSRDMPAAMMLADVVAMPSIQPEPFGRVAIEAQAMGRPVVAFAHGGAVESIQPEETGFLANPLDAADLAQALNEALQLSSDKRSELAKRARTHIVSHFSKQQMCDKTLTLYEELLNQR